MRRTKLVPSILLALALTACGDDGAADEPSGTTSGGTATESTSTGAAEASTGGGRASSEGGETGETSSTGTSSSGGDESSTGADVGPDAVQLALPGEMLFPEGIDVDADGSLYVGSITSSTVLRIDPPYGEDDIVTFSDGQLTRGSIGVFVDDARGVLFVCDSSPAEPTASSLVALDLETGDRVAEHPLQPIAAENPVLCNDGIVAEDGHAYISDSFGARVLRVASEDLLTDGTVPELFVESPMLGPDGEPPFGANGVTELDGELYAVNFNRGTLLRLDRDGDGNADGVTPIDLVDEAGEAIALVGPDGLAVSPNGQLRVVENGLFGGGAGNRVVEVEIDDTMGVVREVAGGFDIPTTAAHTDAYLWVVEGQLDHLFGLDEAPPEPFQLVGVPWD